MDQDRDIAGLIAYVVREETRFLRHYIGQVFVNIDPLKKGRVKVAIPEIGFDTPDKAMWCYPRQGNSMCIPELMDYVEVYFMAGDPNRPVYMHLASEMSDMIPSSFNGLPTTKILFEDKLTGDHIKYDALTMSFTISITGLQILLQNLITNFNLFTHTHIDPLGVTGPPVTGS